MKTCSTCKVDKPISEFQPRRKGSERLHSACRQCTSMYLAEYRAAHKDRITAQKKAWAIKNKDYKAEQDRRYAQMYPERREAARQKWKLANPDKDRAAKAANRADRIMRVPAWADRDQIKAYYNVCASAVVARFPTTS